MSGADAEDDGEWSCEFESWDSNGVRGDGQIAKVIFFNCPFCTSMVVIEGWKLINRFLERVNGI